MKVFFKKRFKYTLDNRNFHEVLPGLYEVPRQVSQEVAELAISLWGSAVIVPTEKPKPLQRKKKRKQAPENKVLKVTEDK